MEKYSTVVLNAHLRDNLRIQVNEVDNTFVTIKQVIEIQTPLFILCRRYICFFSMSYYFDLSYIVVIVHKFILTLFWDELTN